MHDGVRSIQSEYLWTLCWLVMLPIMTCHADDAMFSGYMSHYKWSVEIFCLNEEAEFQPNHFSHTCKCPDTLNYIDVASIPQGQDNQASQFDHRPTSHIASVSIKSEDGGSVLQSIVYNGVIPTAHITYSTPIGRKLDSGMSILTVSGMASELNYSRSGFTGLNIVYPIPINNYTRSLQFFLNSVKIGSIFVDSFWEEYRIFGYLPNTNNTSIGYTVGYVNNISWLPELSSWSSIMVFPISDKDIIYTTDQFQSFFHQKILNNDGMQQNCPNSSQVVIPFGKYILHLGKAGKNIFRINSSGQWTDLEDIPSSTQGSVCLVKAKLSPRLYSTSIVVGLSESRIFVSLLDEEPTSVELKEVIGFDEKSVCDYLSLSDNACNIIDVAFDPSACCKVFVLVFHASNSTYILLKHPDILLKGDWNILTTFSSNLPVESSGIEQIVTNFRLNASNPGPHFTLNGISTLPHPDGVIYMWGDVLFVFDIDSSKLGWIPKFLLNETTDRDTAIQFNSANAKGIYSILTKKGMIWGGISHPFSRPYNWVIERLENPRQNIVISTFFDDQDKLYGLLLLKNESTDLIRREEITFEDESDFNCLRTYNCQRLSLLCHDSDSSVHADLSRLSRTREFFLKHPVLTVKGKSSGIIQRLYNKKSLITYLTVVGRFFAKQKINVPNWWLYEESKQFLTNWWYTQNTPLREHRKYLHFKNSLPNEPLLYLHQGLFQQKRSNRQSSTCFLPKVVYLDKDDRFSFTVVLEHQLSADRLDYNYLRLAVMQSDKSAVTMEVRRVVGSFDVRYYISLIGQQFAHQPPGERLHTVAVTLYPWNPHMFTEREQNASCCWGTHAGMASEKSMLVKVGCPPGRRLVFDSRRSQEILWQRGQYASQDCFTSSSSLPCFTTAEFVAAFYIEDLVTGERKAFEGNYTLTIEGGGVGYLESIEAYPDSEKEQYNYKPGDNGDALIWNVLSETSVKGMQDTATGNLIFSGKNPSSIVFECRMDSPCGSIPLGSANPSEYYFEIEASNKGVDSSTNCDYTIRFQVRFIGMQLSPRIHLYLMLVTLSIIMLLLLLYYFCHWCGYDRIWKVDRVASEDWSMSENPPLELRDALTRRRNTLVGLSLSYPRSDRRSSVLMSQALNSNSERRLTYGIKRS